MNTWTKEEQAEHRRLWVEALRSGDYEQGRYMLVSGKTFCCLGVACDISGLGKWSGEDFVTEDESRFRGLPYTVRDWLGLAESMGEHGDRSLADLNDSGWDFLALADIIESEPEGLLAPEASP